MSDADELTLTIHGLDVFNRDVDGELFARKFFKFMQGIAEADTAANGKRRHKFLISDLKKNTATASVREQVVTGTEQTKSSFDFFEDGLSAIYEDAPRARSLPLHIVTGKQWWYRDWETDRKSTRLNSSHRSLSRMPSSA